MSLPSLDSNTTPGSENKSLESRRKPLGNLAEAQHKKLLRSAKLAVGFVGVLIFGAYAFSYQRISEAGSSLEAQVRAATNNSAIVLDQAKVEEARAQIAFGKLQCIGFAGLGLILLSCLFFMNSYPSPTTKLAFGLYILFNVISIALNPETVGSGILGKLLITAALYKGMQAGQSIEKLRKEEAMGLS